MKKILITALLFLTSIITVIVIDISWNKPEKDIFVSCNFNVQTQSNAHDLSNITSTLRTRYFFYTDGTGFKTEMGKISLRNGTYTIDRESKFIYDDNDNDGVYIIRFKSTIKRSIDNTPSGTVDSTPEKDLPLYIAFYKIGDIFYLRERGYPFIMCTNDG